MLHAALQSCSQFLTGHSDVHLRFLCLVASCIMFCLISGSHDVSLIHAARHVQGRIHWYTSMVGKKATLKGMRQLLLSHRVTALRTTEFVQGRTMRWGLAWSFAVPGATASVPLQRGAKGQRHAAAVK